MLKQMAPILKRDFDRRMNQLARDMERSCNDCDAIGQMCETHAYELHDVKTISDLKAAELRYSAVGEPK